MTYSQFTTRNEPAQHDTIMSHDDATAASGDPFDGVDTASEITEQTGMVSEFTMEREERAAAGDKPATGIEEIKEDIIDEAEAASVSPSVSTQQEKIKARAQQMVGQAKAMSSRAIESAKSYDQVSQHILWVVRWPCAENVLAAQAIMLCVKCGLSALT